MTDDLSNRGGQDRARVSADQEHHQDRHDDGAEGGEDEDTRQRDRGQHRMIQWVVGVPRPPPQLRAELVEHLVEAVVHEPDADGAHHDAAIAEDVQAADDLVSQRDHGWIQGHDVQRKPLEQKLDREGVVREHDSELSLDPEDVREVQRYLDDKNARFVGSPSRRSRRIEYHSASTAPATIISSSTGRVQFDNPNGLRR